LIKRIKTSNIQGQKIKDIQLQEI